MSPEPPYHLIPDLLRGLFKGAYAVDHLHTPGLLVWIAVGFVPIAGTLAAVRDAYYSLEVRAWGALFLNLIGLLPFMKGFANLVEVTQLRRFHQVHRLAHTAHQVAHVAQHGRTARVLGRRANVVTGVSHEAGAVVLRMDQPPLPAWNGAAWPALLLAFPLAFFVTLAVILIPDLVAGGSLLTYRLQPATAVGIVACTLVASFGALALARHARHTAQLLAGRPFARSIVALAALWLAWYTIAVSVALVALVLYMERSTM